MLEPQVPLLVSSCWRQTSAQAINTQYSKPTMHCAVIAHHILNPGVAIVCRFWAMTAQCVVALLYCGFIACAAVCRQRLEANKGTRGSNMPWRTPWPILVHH